MSWNIGFGLVLILFLCILHCVSTESSSDEVGLISRLLIAKMDNFERRVELDIKFAKYELRREIRRSQARRKGDVGSNQNFLFELRSLRMDVVQLSKTVDGIQKSLSDTAENQTAITDERLQSMARNITLTKHVVENMAALVNNLSLAEQITECPTSVPQHSEDNENVSNMVPLGLTKTKARNPDWDGLKVTWGPDQSKAFRNIPRTRREAKIYGWTNMAPDLKCDDHPNFKGERYWRDSDASVVLIYNKEGNIAGMQAGVPKDNDNYPFPELINQPFVVDGDHYFVTAYFENPDDLCETSANSVDDYLSTGAGLWLQNGTHPVNDSTEIPQRQSDMGKTMWNEGPCFKTMGVHYWYNIREDMSCNTFFPVFLLYNNGMLNAFGWAFGVNLNNSKWMEHPTAAIYPVFLNPVPDCLYTLGNFSTQHIFLTKNISANTC